MSEGQTAHPQGPRPFLPTPQSADSAAWDVATSADSKAEQCARKAESRPNMFGA
jgi:hypothetical protein